MPKIYEKEIIVTGADDDTLEDDDPKVARTSEEESFVLEGLEQLISGKGESADALLADLVHGQRLARWMKRSPELRTLVTKWLRRRWRRLRPRPAGPPVSE